MEQFKEQHVDGTYGSWIKQINRVANNTLDTTNIMIGKKMISKKPPWWNYECHQKEDNKRPALRAFKMKYTLDYVLNYKKIKAETRRMHRRKRKAKVKYLQK